MKREEALTKLREALPQLRRQYAVASLAVFGSTARNEARNDSDVDVLVSFSETPDYFAFSALQRRLAALLGAPVDLTTERSLHPMMKASILADAVHA